MSRDWGFYCATCDEEGWGRYGDFNHQEQGFKDLLPHLPFFAEVARRGFDVDFESLGVYGNQRSGLAAWALKHDGHRILVRSEYGEISEHCGRSVNCPTCGGDRLHCGLPDGHDGPCTLTEGPK